MVGCAINVKATLGLGAVAVFHSGEPSDLDAETGRAATRVDPSSVEPPDPSSSMFANTDEISRRDLPTGVARFEPGRRELTTCRCSPLIRVGAWYPEADWSGVIPDTGGRAPTDADMDTA